MEGLLDIYEIVIHDVPLINNNWHNKSSFSPLLDHLFPWFSGATFWKFQVVDHYLQARGSFCCKLSCTNQNQPITPKLSEPYGWQWQLPFITSWLIFPLITSQQRTAVTTTSPDDNDDFPSSLYNNRWQWTMIMTIPPSPLHNSQQLPFITILSGSPYFLLLFVFAPLM